VDIARSQGFTLKFGTLPNFNGKVLEIRNAIRHGAIYNATA
jgi:hypothetical protein